MKGRGLKSSLPVHKVEFHPRIPTMSASNTWITRNVCVALVYSAKRRSQSTDFRWERTRRKQYAPPRRGIIKTILDCEHNIGSWSAHWLTVPVPPYRFLWTCSDFLEYLIGLLLISSDCLIMTKTMWNIQIVFTKFPWNKENSLNAETLDCPDQSGS